MSTKRKGKKETKQESPTQYKVVDPISLADLENIHTRKGKYPTRPPPFGQLTWEEAKREKEEKLKKLRKERSPSTPLETTSTEAKDTEEAQEFGKEIVAKATERQLKRQEYTRYQQRRQQTVELISQSLEQSQFPNWKNLEKRESPGLNQSLSNSEVPNYEEISMFSGKPSILSRSVPATQQNKEKGEYGGARPKIPSTNKTAFQDYTSEMMRALNNPWKPKGRKTATPVGAKIAPLVYLLLSGTPVEGQPTKEEGNENQLALICQLWTRLNLFQII